MYDAYSLPAGYVMYDAINMLAVLILNAHITCLIHAQGNRSRMMNY